MNYHLCTQFLRPHNHSEWRDCLGKKDLLDRPLALERTSWGFDMDMMMMMVMMISGLRGGGGDYRPTDLSAHKGVV